MARGNSSSNFTRREFLAVTATSLIAASASRLPGEEKPWYAEMRRCGQINFNERDPLTMDANAWLDYWASLKVNAVLLNGGGIVAFYPTEIPYHHRAQKLAAMVIRNFCGIVAFYPTEIPYHHRSQFLGARDL